MINDPVFDDGSFTPTNKHSGSDGKQPAFTLSYLRRAPDLRYLARRVVLAEAKRHDRKTRKAERDQSILLETQRTPSRSTNDSHSSSSRSGTQSMFKSITTASLTSSMRKLFEDSLRRLYHEGEIVIVPERRRPYLPTPTSFSISAPYPACLGRFRVWSDPSPQQASVSSPHTKSRTSGRILDDSQSPIDDEPPIVVEDNEECYLALTTTLLAPEIQKIIRYHYYHYVTKTDRAVRLNTIMTSLGRRDSMWRRVGEWSVKECLVHLEENQKIWEQQPGQYMLIDDF